ncbi:hypothetical protein [Hymenobacter crusticola]|uniref:Uncharacterized protein n=1 Tax=Hymenobacter crusticola TaxID=1770526 RepID=A0A243W8Y0_9BACT|nr:hypothetical protein [Hymenobacter crusticola]OUJ70033.1 hypothetical protein BXP70_25515 [Hymenobacter crusticola]
MFLGHFGVGFGAKTLQPRVSLGTFFLAAQLADLVWPTLLLLGVERVNIVPHATATNAFAFVYYPFTHSLVGELVAGLLLGLVYWLLRRNGQSAMLVGLLVPSHWLLDVVVHTPDLPLYPGPSPLFGLGLWNQIALTQVVEFALLGAGLWLYVRRTTVRNGKGRYGLLGLVAFLVLIHVGSLFSPPPASVEALGWSGQLFWVIVLLAYWVDRNRAVRGLPEGEPRRAAVPPIS